MEKIIMDEKPKKHTHVFLVVVIVLLVVWNVQQLFRIVALEDEISELQYVAKEYEDFASNLYATRNSTGSEGSHTLSVSDIYYRKNFTKDDNK